MAITEVSRNQTEQLGERLEGRVAMVTGGTRGIGAAICWSLARAGAEIAAGYANDHERAAKFQADLTNVARHVSIHQGNIASPDDCRRTVAEVIEQHGRIDILVNNAGITSDRLTLKMTDAEWSRVLEINLSGTFFMCKAALTHMVDQGNGRIVNISSIIGQRGNIGQVNYAASKSGLFGLTTSLAREAAFALKREGKLDAQGCNITVNAVAPGYVETDMLAGVPESVLDKVRSEIPLGRLGRPEEIGRVVGFLCSDASSYITGQVWAVNGGHEM